MCRHPRARAWGATRYVLYTPTTYNAAQKTPLVVNIHGAGSSPYIHVRPALPRLAAPQSAFSLRHPHARVGCARNVSQALWTGFDEVAEDTGILLAYPKGDPRTFCCGTGCFCSDEGSTAQFALPFPPHTLPFSVLTAACAVRSLEGGASIPPDDVGFIRLIVDDVAARRNLDRSRVYATGHSNGGYMSYRLACSASDIFAAVAPVSAGSPWISDFLGNCRPTRPVPVLTLHGNADDVVPYSDGEAVFGYGGRPAQLRIAQAAATAHTVSASMPAPSFRPPIHRDFQLINNCTGTPVVTFANGTTTCEAWTSCASQGNGLITNMTFCTTDGGSHLYWPGSPIARFNQDLPASQEVRAQRRRE